MPAPRKGRAAYEQALNPSGPRLAPIPKVPGPLGPGALAKRTHPPQPNTEGHASMQAQGSAAPRGTESEVSRPSRTVPTRAPPCPPQDEPKVETGLTMYVPPVPAGRKVPPGGSPSKARKYLFSPPGPSAQSHTPPTHPPMSSKFRRGGVTAAQRPSAPPALAQCRYT